MNVKHSMASFLNILDNAGFSLEQKMRLLQEAGSDGNTALAISAFTGYEEAATAILDNVPLEQRPLLLSYIHPIRGQVNVIELAFENGHTNMVALLQQYGAHLPERLTRGPEATFNNSQSTHTATVHDSLARSAIACVARLKTLTQKESDTLTTWAKGKLSDPNERVNHHAVLAVMEHPHIQEQLNALVARHYPDILTWANNLDNNHPKKAILLRAINRINITDHNEARSNLTLVQLLVLTWMGIKAEKGDIDNPKALFSNKNLLHRENRFIQYLWEIQRQYNLNDEGEDFDPQAEDDPACPGGTFNNIIMALSGGADPDVKFVFVNKEAVLLKATSLLIQLFNPEDPEYTPEIIESLNKNFLDEDDNVPSYTFSEETKAILRSKIIDGIRKEYNEYLLSKTLNEEEIQRGIQTMLDIPKNNIVQAVTKKLLDFKEKQKTNKPATNTTTQRTRLK